MRGVDGRGGGFSGDRANPPPAGGRGRGMVLPAWLVAQQNAQMGGPVSFFFLAPGSCAGWLAGRNGTFKNVGCCRDIG